MSSFITLDRALELCQQRRDTHFVLPDGNILRFDHRTRVMRHMSRAEADRTARDLDFIPWTWNGTEHGMRVSGYHDYPLEFCNHGGSEVAVRDSGAFTVRRINARKLRDHLRRLGELPPLLGHPYQMFCLTCCAPSALGAHTLWTESKDEARAIFLLEHPGVQPGEIVTIEPQKRAKAPKLRKVRLPLSADDALAELLDA